MPGPNLKDTVHTQMIAAMKAGNKERTQVLRMMLSEIKRVEADKPDADPQAAVTAYGKSLKKTMAEMEGLKQAERVEQLKAELTIVEEFLPKQMDDATLEKIVTETMAGLGVVTKKESGKAMGAIMKAVAATGGTADANKVRALIESRITT